MIGAEKGMSIYERVIRPSIHIAVFLPCFLSVNASVSWGQAAPAAQPPRVVLDQADSLLRKGEADHAIALLNQLTQTDPRLPGVEARLGKAYFSRKSLDRAATHLQAAVKEAPDDWESGQLLALTYYRMGDYQKAVPSLLQVSPHLPKGQADAPHILGICYLHMQQWDNARKAFADMFGVSPESPMAHLMLAKMMIGAQLEDQSVPEVEKALELDSRLPMAHFMLGEVYLFKNNPQKALTEFQRELEINPTVWLVYWRLGDTYKRLRQYDEAEKALKQALWLNETFTGSYLMLGEIELQKGNPDLAAGFLEYSLKLDPQNYYAHYYLGRAYQQLGRTDEATRQFALQASLRNDKHKAESDRMESLSH